MNEIHEIVLEFHDNSGGIRTIQQPIDLQEDIHDKERDVCFEMSRLVAGHPISQQENQIQRDTWNIVGAREEENNMEKALSESEQNHVKQKDFIMQLILTSIQFCRDN